MNFGIPIKNIEELLHVESKNITLGWPALALCVARPGLEPMTPLPMGGSKPPNAWCRNSVWPQARKGLKAPSSPLRRHSYHLQNNALFNPAGTAR
jgi:hypothetical protein